MERMKKEEGMTPEEYIAMVEEENKKLKEEIKSRQEEVERFKTNAMQDMTEITELEKENKKLREDNRFLTKISKEYMEEENIIEITEFTELYKDDLEKENERLKKENEELKEYKSMYEGLCK